MALSFLKKNNEKELQEFDTVAKDRILFEVIANDDGRMAVLVDKLKQGTPLVLCFEKLDIDAGNKMLAFLQGAIYAIDGETRKITDDTYLFARKVDFQDGSLDEFIRNLKE